MKPEKIDWENRKGVPKCIECGKDVDVRLYTKEWKIINDEEVCPWICYSCNVIWYEDEKPEKSLEKEVKSALHKSARGQVEETIEEHSRGQRQQITQKKCPDNLANGCQDFQTSSSKQNFSGKTLVNFELVDKFLEVTKGESVFCLLQDFEKKVKELTRKECEKEFEKRFKGTNMMFKPEDAPSELIIFTTLKQQNEFINKIRADEQKEFDKERQAIEHLLRTDSTIARVCEEVGIRPTEHPFLYTVTEQIERLKEDERNKVIEEIEKKMFTHYDKDTEIIWCDIKQDDWDNLKKEDFTKEQLKRIKLSEKQFKEGKFKSLEEVKNNLKRGKR